MITKVGGQKGREGKTLTQTDEPDNVVEVDFNIEECKNCGSPLEALKILLNKGYDVQYVDII